nr:hypothetical protein GCM10020185_79850 [Pseudomonas brassicacearum subsp. brassicacearum]
MHDLQRVTGQQPFQITQCFDRVFDFRDLVAGVRECALVGVVQDLQDDLLLVAEVLEDGRRRYAGLAGDLFDGGVLETLALEQFDRRLADGLAAFGFF